jgi:hypothetical protein
MNEIIHEASLCTIDPSCVSLVRDVDKRKFHADDKVPLLVSLLIAQLPSANERIEKMNMYMYFE